MITLQNICAENFDDILALHVKEGQEHLVASNAESIAQAYVQPECIPMAIFDEAVPVGFIMYCLDQDDGEYWLYRFMVDARYQGRGYGRTALGLVLDKIKADAEHHKIYLGVDLSGGASLRLYQSLGFRFDGRVYGKEHIMVLTY